MFCSGESGILLARVLTTALSLAFARGTDVVGYVTEGPGLSAYALEDGTVYRTYVTTARGLEPAMAYYALLTARQKAAMSATRGRCGCGATTSTGRASEIQRSTGYGPGAAADSSSRDIPCLRSERSSDGKTRRVGLSEAVASLVQPCRV